MIFRIPVFLAIGASYALPAQSPQVFLAELFSHYDPPGQIREYSPFNRKDTLFAPELLDLMLREEKAAQGEVGYFDGDPICDCQDDSLSNIVIKAVPKGRDRSSAKVFFANYGHQDTLGYDLLYLGGRWKIAEIKSSREPSLRKGLREWLKQYGPRAASKQR